MKTAETYEERMMRILLGINAGWTSPFAGEVTALIREQARMIVQLEAELDTAYDYPLTEATL